MFFSHCQLIRDYLSADWNLKADSWFQLFISLILVWYEFSTFQRDMFPQDNIHIKNILVLKIYFRLAQKNSKWPPKILFSQLPWFLMDGVSKFQQDLFTKDSTHLKDILVLKIYSMFARKKSKRPPKKRVFVNNMRSNGWIFKYPTAYVH